jgi:hypothetical protein
VNLSTRIIVPQNGRRSKAKKGSILVVEKGENSSFDLQDEQAKIKKPRAAASILKKPDNMSRAYGEFLIDISFAAC